MRGFSFFSNESEDRGNKTKTKHFPNQPKMALLLCRRFYSLFLRRFTTFGAIFDLKSPDAHDACAILILFVSDILIMAFSIITFERHFYIRTFQKHLGCCFVNIYTCNIEFFVLFSYLMVYSQYSFILKVFFYI